MPRPDLSKIRAKRGTIQRVYRYLGESAETSPSILRQALICIAFATWCFLDTWVGYAEGDLAYFLRHDPLHEVVLPVVLLEIIFTTLLFLTWEICLRQRWTRNLWALRLFVISCFVPLGIGSIAALRLLPFRTTLLFRAPIVLPVLLIISTTVVILAWMRPARSERVLSAILLHSWPVLALLLIQAFRMSLNFGHSGYLDGRLAVSLKAPPPQVRVVWIIFDEASQAITFGNRPAGLELPNLDRLKNSSFYASAAEAPADATRQSIPSLITGEQVVEALPRDQRTLLLQTTSHPDLRSWGGMPNVFDDARELGLNTALVGWYFPYGRSLNHSLTRCYWTAGWAPAGVEERLAPQPLGAAMLDRLRLQWNALPLMGHLPWMFPEQQQREEKIRKFAWLRARALDVVSDPAIGLAFIHLPVPHPPAIYDGNELGTVDSAGYLDNLRLADRTLGDLRQAMEVAGLSDRTAILVSADHGWRTSLWRGNAEWRSAEEAASHQDTAKVPFLLHLPRQRSSQTYNGPLHTLVTRRVIGSILRDQLRDPAAIVDLFGHSLR